LKIAHHAPELAPLEAAVAAHHHQAHHQAVHHQAHQADQSAVKLKVE